MRDRRVEARFAPPSDVELQATMRPGCSVVLVDISGRGAMVQGPRPLRPGARVHLVVSTTARKYAIAAHVRRCLVWALDPVDGVTYRGAVEFEQHVDWRWTSDVGEGRPCEQVVPAAPIAGNGGPARAAATHDSSARWVK